MIIKRFRVFTYLIIVLLAGCKTTSVVQTEPVVTESSSPDTQNEFRGLLITTNATGSQDAGIMENNIRLLVTKASDANFNAILIPDREILASSDLKSDALGMDSKDNHLIDALIQESHQNGLKMYLSLDLFDLLTAKSGTDFSEFLTEEEISPEIAATYMNFLSQEADAVNTLETIFSDQVFPYLKSHLKEQVKKIIERHNIDGISYDLTSWAKILNNSISQPENDNNVDIQSDEKENNIMAERLIDLIEDLVVETMLIKPYLVNSIIYPNSMGHEFFLNCLEKKIVDFIVPKFNTSEDNLIDEFSDLWNHEDDRIAEGIFPCITVFDKDKDKPVIDDLLAFNKEMGSGGILISTDITIDKKISFHNIPYTFNDPILLPKNLKKSTPFEVAGLKVAPLINEDTPGSSIDLYGATRKKLMDANGKIGIVLTHPDSIDIEISEQMTILKTNQWSVPYKYIVYPDSVAIRDGPWIELRRMPSVYTTEDSYHLLCKTSYPASAWIDNDSVKVYKTGIFFKEIKFNKGSNRIRARVITPDSLSVFYEREFVYEKIDQSRPVFPLWIDRKSVKPSMDLELLPEDIVNISFHGSLGQKAFVELFPGGDVIKCARKDFKDYSHYMAEIPLTKLVIDKEYQFILHLETEVDSIQRKIYKFPLENKIMTRSLDQYPIVKIKEEYSRLTYNLGPIRLGGPIRSELGVGIMMKVNGKMGDNYRIRLDKIENSIVRQDQVEVLPKETVPPSYFISNISCVPGKEEDIVSIPYLEQVPYAINPEPDQNRIVITLYGVKTSSTWITHRKGRKVVDKITWQQSTPDTYKVYVNLKTSRVWGYDLQPDGRQLVLRIKHPPQYELNNEKPLAGLKIAIEAGHGGESTGAVGLSGLLEKDINLDLALKFGEICKSMGAEVYQVRETDMTMGLLEKRNKAISSDADILISIHANAAGTSGGYLRVPGTSTYYNNPFWAPLAENVYDRLLELGLAEFGVVGSFNYTVIRVSQMPTILVEQAFMTHAEDEEKLADPDFRQLMAIKIFEGILDYLSYMESANE